MMQRIARLLFHNWKPKLISLIIACCLWVYTQTQKYADIVVTVPVVYRFKPAPLSFKSEPRRFVKIKIRGFKENLKFPTGNLKAQVDLSKATTNRKDYPLIFDAKQLPEKVEVIDMPSTIRLRLEESIQKMVRVRYIIKGRPAAGYSRGRVSLRPEKILLSGPRSIVKNIRYIDTNEINIQGENRAVNKSVGFDLPEGVKSLSGARANVRVLIFTENTVNEKVVSGITLQTVNVDPALVALVSDKTVKIQIDGESASLKKITAKDFQASVDLEGTSYNPETGNILPFESESGIPVQVKLLKYKNNVNIINVVPENITVRFQVKPEFKKRSVDNTNNDTVKEKVEDGEDEN